MSGFICDNVVDGSSPKTKQEVLKELVYLNLFVESGIDGLLKMRNEAITSIAGLGLLSRADAAIHQSMPYFDDDSIKEAALKVWQGYVPLSVLEGMGDLTHPEELYEKLSKINARNNLSR